jgi:hypothetical protein
MAQRLVPLQDVLDRRRLGAASELDHGAEVERCVSYTASSRPRSTLKTSPSMRKESSAS